MATEDALICPLCYGTVERTAAVCATCRESVWLDGRLALERRLDPNHPNVFRGLLRGTDGVEEVVVKVLDVGGLRDWRDHDRFCAQKAILDVLKDLAVPRALGDFECGGRVFHCQTRMVGSPLSASRS